MNRNLYFLTLLSLLFLLAACGDKEMSDQEHLALKEADKELRQIHDDFADELDDAIDIQEDLEDAITDTTNAVMVTTIKSQAAELARLSGIVAGQDKIFTQHKEYFRKHEDTALGANEIIGQHEQITKDQAAMRSQNSDIQRSLDAVKRELDRL